MKNLQKAMLKGRLDTALLRTQAQQMATKAKTEGVKPRHSFPYAYAFLAVKKLFPNTPNSEVTMFQQFETVTTGLTSAEKLGLFEFLIFSFGTGFNKNPWQGLEATFKDIQSLPNTLRWRGESDPEAELTLYRGVAAHDEASATERHLRPLWSTWKVQALVCCISWLDDYPNATPVLARASIKYRDIVAITNPGKHPEALEVVINPKKLYNLEVSFPTLEVIEAALAEALIPPVKNMLET